MTRELTARELDVLRCVAEGLTDKETAAELRLSLTTVKWLGRSVRRKLDATDRASAVHRAHRAGLLA